jgi:Protein of unknown function (DUF5661)
VSRRRPYGALAVAAPCLARGAHVNQCCGWEGLGGGLEIGFRTARKAESGISARTVYRAEINRLAHQPELRLTLLTFRATERSRTCLQQGSFTAAEARQVGEQIGIDWPSAPFDVEQFRTGMDVELEHGLHDPATNVTNDDPVATGKIALAHLNEFPNYYTRLERMEDAAKRAHGSTETVS